MIVFDLSCPNGHRFEGWFSSSKEYDFQSKKGLVSCPECGSVKICKAPMAPSVPVKSNSKPDLPQHPGISAGNGGAGRKQKFPKENFSLSKGAIPHGPSLGGKPDLGSKAVSRSRSEIALETEKTLKNLAEMQAEALKNSKWVGRDFAETSRAMHYGDEEPMAIHGETTLDEAKSLSEEGIAVAPLPFPIVRRKDLN